MEFFLPLWLLFVSIWIFGVICGLSFILVSLPFIMRWTAQKEHQLQAQIKQGNMEAEMKARQDKFNEIQEKYSDRSNEVSAKKDE